MVKKAALLHPHSSLQFLWGYDRGGILIDLPLTHQELSQFNISVPEKSFNVH